MNQLSYLFAIDLEGDVEWKFTLELLDALSELRSFWRSFGIIKLGIISTDLESKIPFYAYHFLILEFWRMKHGQVSTAGANARTSLQPAKASNPRDCCRSHYDNPASQRKRTLRIVKGHLKDFGS